MKVAAIIVLYNPDEDGLLQLVNAVLQQADCLCLVDNATCHSASEIQNERVCYLNMGCNKGIAEAQNEAIRHILLKGNFDYILFGDQDSMIPSGAVKRLQQTFSALEEKGVKVGAVASKAYNKQTGTPYPYEPGGANQSVEANVVEVSYAMNSISLFRTEYFRTVGLMDETLFIDGVDSEICWRGTLQGYRFFVDERVRIAHQLGLGCKTILGRELSISSPKRMFFQYRNYFILCRRKYTPVVWKRHNGCKYIIKLFFYPLFVSPRWEYINNMARGIWAGVRNNRNIKNEKNI